MDTPDFEPEMSPDNQGDLQRGRGTTALAGDKPFILHPDGVGWLFVTSGLKDGPVPTHYEPLESLCKNPGPESQQTNPPSDRGRFARERTHALEINRAPG